MRQILLFAGLIAMLLAASSCEDKNDGRLDPNAKISLRAAKNTPKTADAATRAEEHLSAREIVERAHTIAFTNKRYIPDSKGITRGFAENQRDIANERLLMYGTDIISYPQGELNNNFIGAEDVVIQGLVNLELSILDTIAYIPDATLRAAEIAVKEAYAREDYTAVYKLFDSAFTFLPITGAEWRELKAKGQN